MVMSVINNKDAISIVEPTARELRKSLRFPLTASVEVTEFHSGARIMGRTSDLSLGGCYIDSMSPFPVGTIATIRITRDNESFEAQAKVVYSQMGMGMGMSFISAQPKEIRLFQRWVSEISGKEVLSPDVPEQKHEVTDGNLREESNYVLNELIIALMRNGALTEAEGKAMLKRLLR
jgi:hypothetical protein